MKGNPNRTLSQNAPSKTKENMHKKYPKVTFNLLDKPANKDSDFKNNKLSVINFKSQNLLRKVSSNLNNNNNNNNNHNNNHLKEPKKILKKLSQNNLEYDSQFAKSSGNIKNNLLTKTFITKAKIAKTKSQYESNNNQNKEQSQNKKSKLEQRKINFLKLITRTNEGNYIKEYSRANNSLLEDDNSFEFNEEDSLDKVEKKLQDKIFNIGKEVEFMEFEIEPLDMTINNYNNKRQKRRLISKKTRDSEGRKKEKKKKFMTTAIRKKKNMLSQITSTNSRNAISDNYIFNKKNENDIFNNNNLDDSAKLFLNEKKNVHKHTNFLRKLKFGASNIKQSKISHNLKQSIFMHEKNNNSNSINLYDKLTSIFKTNHPKFFPKKSTILTKSKTYSNIESKIGQSFISNTESFDKMNSLSSDKEMPIIDKEKFRILSHKKLVYDSLDDEELIEDAVTDNFYILPNSKFIIIIDAVILMLTLWSMVYKPLYLVLDNCDIKNTVNTISFYNISNLFIDGLFIFDLIINFFKAYYNFDEQLVSKANLIFCHYIKGYFIIDLVSAIPYYTIIKFIALNRFIKYRINPSCSKYFNHKINDGFQIIELLKLLKVIKCMSKTNIVTNYFIANLNNISFFENWSYLIFNICIFFLLLHLTACMHIFISITAYPNWIILKNLDMSSFPTVYLSSIYFLITTVTSVGYGDITGNSFTEFCFQIFILLVGIIAYSWLISSLSNYVKENNSQNEIFRKKISMLNEILLEHPKMPKELYDKIYLHLEYINLKQKKDKSALIDSLPHTIKKSLLYEMYRPIIDNFNFFKNFKNSEFINKVISKLKPIIAVKNDILLEQGEIIEETFFVKQGRLGLEVKIDTIHPEKSVQKLLNEEYFLGVENNELYQQNAFNLPKMTTIKQKITVTSINKNKNKNNNLLNLFKKTTLNINKENQEQIKSVIINDEGKGEIKRHQKFNSNYICLKILDIRKNEHFGALLMFLNKRSPLRIRVKTKKAELFFLKKIDAIEISSSYPNIWQRNNRASFHNLKQIKRIMNKIIIHFCETYGINFMNKISEENDIKDMDDLKKFYTLQRKITKGCGSNNFSSSKKNNINNNMNRNLYTSLASRAQLKMLKEFINNNNSDNINNSNKNNYSENDDDNDSNDDSETVSNNQYEEKNIVQPVLKDLDFDNENDISNDNNKNLSLSKNNDSSSEKDYIKNCTLNANIFKNKNNSTKKDKSTFDKKNSNNKTISEESDETRTKDELNKNNKKIKNGNDESNKLNFKASYYPEEINNKNEKNEIKSNNSRNNNNIEELEYTPLNYILSSQGSMKNNYIQTINEFNLNKINYDKRNPNNFTINNNFITNNVINNISPQKIKNEFSIVHFNFNFKKKNEMSNVIQKQNNNINKINNLSIFKNSFEITPVKKEKSINLKNKKIVSNKNKIKINNNFTSSDSDSSFSSSSDKKNKNNNKSRELDKSFTYEIPLKKKIEHSSNSSDSSSSSHNIGKDNNNNDKSYKIHKNKRFKFNAEYFNLNKLTKGKFSKNLKFQNYIKNIIIEKLSDINHSKVELPKIRESIKAKVSSSALPLNKKKISKKFSAYLPLSNIRNEKLKNSIPKMQRNNLMISLQNEKGNPENINSTKKKVNRKSNKSNNNDVFLKQVTRNIRDDSTVLNDPGKFYNGLFNGLMKRYTKANFKPFQK